MNKILLIIIFFISESILGAQSSLQIKHKSHPPLDLIILLDSPKFSNELYHSLQGRLGACTSTFVTAISERLPIIASSCFLINLKLLAKKYVPYRQMLNVINGPNWIVLFSKSNDFVILLPKHYLQKIYSGTNLCSKSNKHILNYLGFNYDFLHEKRNIGFIDVIHNTIITAPQNNINFDNFKNLFRTGSKTPRKRIILDGHGAPDLNIAGLSLGFSIAGVTFFDQYTNFLELLTQINVDFLCVISCYTAGKNLLVMHDYLVKKTKTLQNKIKYAIIIASTTDAQVHTSFDPFREKHLDKFFSKLRTFMKNPSWFVKPKFGTSNIPIQEILSILSDMFHPYNAAAHLSICFPGSTFFRVVYAPETRIITWMDVKTAIFNAKKNNLTNAQIEISTINELLIYPSLIRECTLDFKNAVAECTWVSMIPGNALHIIDKVNAQHISFDLMFWGMCRPPLYQPPFHMRQSAQLYMPDTSVHNKAWLVKEIECLNYKTSGLQRPADEVLKIEDLAVGKVNKLLNKDIIIIFKFNGEYYYAFVSATELVNGPEVLKWSKMSRQTYEIWLDLIKKSSFPNAKALYEATAGNENLDELNAAYNDFKGINSATVMDKLKFFKTYLWSITKCRARQSIARLKSIIQMVVKKG